MLAARGVLTARGGATSHAAVVARSMGLPCVAGAETLKIDYARREMKAGKGTVREGDMISIDGTTGEIFAGELPTIEARFEDEHDLATLLGWADEVRRLQVWANADYPRDARARRELRGAGHRPVPDRAHVLRGGAPADRAAHDPRRHTGPPRPSDGRDAGSELSADDTEAIATFDSALAELECSRPMTSPASSGRWTACRSSSA